MRGSFFSLITCSLKTPGTPLSIEYSIYYLDKHFSNHFSYIRTGIAFRLGIGFLSGRWRGGHYRILFADYRENGAGRMTRNVHGCSPDHRGIRERFMLGSQHDQIGIHGSSQINDLFGRIPSPDYFLESALGH